jgi:hypothetical protein
VSDSDESIVRRTHPDLNEEQKAVFCAIALYRMSAYVAGEAGSGKTYTIRKAVDFMHDEGAYVKVAAPTACAAHRACTTHVVGLTLHILFRIRNILRKWEDPPFTAKAGSGIDAFLADTDNEVSYCSGILDFAPSTVTGRFPTAVLTPTTIRDLNCVDCIVIDEVSMCCIDLIELIHCTLCRIHGKRKLPFGGVQVVFTGDFGQLPPIQPFPRADRKIFAFEHDSFAILPRLLLKKIMRQADPMFTSILGRMRDGTVSMRDCKWIHSNSSNFTDLSSFAIFSSNAKVEQRNRLFYDQNHNPETEMRPTKMCWIGNPGTPDFRAEPDCSNILGNNVLYPPGGRPFKLKVGCRVQCTSNVYADGHRHVPKFRNGQTGTVHQIHGLNRVIVLFDGDSTPVEMPTKSNLRTQSFKVGTKEVVAITIFVPLALAWACTIHKEQGASWTEVVDIDPWAWFKNNNGHWEVQKSSAYTALSRVTHVKHIRLVGNPLTPSAFRVHPRVKEYNKWLFGTDTTRAS